MRPLRSWMFVPGSRQRFIDKALALPVDAIFLDLEDGVPPGEKALARQLVAAALGRPGGGPARYVRMNAIGTAWAREDLRDVLNPGLEGLCLPKVERPDDVLHLAEALAPFEQHRGLLPGAVRIIAAIESARGLFAAPAIAASHPRVMALMFGAEDFALDLGLGTRREQEARELIYARSAVVAAAASAHVIAIDGVFPDLEDPEGLVADAAQARRLGFAAKSLFNPRQIEAINRVFSPAPEEIAYAQRVVQAFKEATARGEGAAAVGGQLVDLPIVQRAQRLLDMLPDLDGPAQRASTKGGER